MYTVGAFEAKTHFSALLERVEHGENIMITKHGKPIVKMIPILGNDKEQIKLAIQAIKELRKKHTLGELDWKLLRDEGRK